MYTTKSWVAGLLFLGSVMAEASAQSPSKPGRADLAPSTVGTSPGTGIYSGYGNYWYPTNYPYPSIGGSAYVQFGFGSVNPYYYSVPGSSTPANSLTSNRSGALAKEIKRQAAPARNYGSGPKAEPAKPKPR